MLLDYSVCLLMHCSSRFGRYNPKLAATNLERLYEPSIFEPINFSVRSDRDSAISLFLICTLTSYHGIKYKCLITFRLEHAKVIALAKVMTTV